MFGAEFLKTGDKLTQIKLDPLTLSRVRFRVSPLREVVASLVLLASYGSHASWPYGGWLRFASRASSTPELAQLTAWFRTLGGAVPAFLTPAGDRELPDACPTIDDELAEVCQTDPDTVRAQLGGLPRDIMPSDLAEVVDDPRAAAQWLADALAAYWHAALEPYWTTMRAALEEEILLRGRILATQGVDTLFCRLYHRIQWADRRLTISGPPGTAVLHNSELRLVPLLFARGAVSFQQPSPGLGVISYPARGAAVLADPPPRPHRGSSPQRGDSLAVLLGASRAAIVRSLTIPTTTKSLAQSLGLAASTVSEHLTALTATGLLQRRRTGGRVLYELDRTGLAMLRHFNAGSACGGA
jgi:DNA-binding transcriptional ArsR family regulator